MLSFNSQSFQLFNVFRSLSLSPFSLYISKFPFYIQRHYRKAFNSSHNVLCIWILKEEMETFFAAAFTPPAIEGAQEKKEKKKKFLLLYCSFDMILIKEFPVLKLKSGKIVWLKVLHSFVREIYIVNLAYIKTVFSSKKAFFFQHIVIVQFVMYFIKTDFL